MRRELRQYDVHMIGNADSKVELYFVYPHLFRIEDGVISFYVDDDTSEQSSNRVEQSPSLLVEVFPINRLIRVP